MALFFDSLAHNQPGLKDELEVWKLVKEVFSGREAIAFMHFPLFQKNGHGRKEIDILVIDRQMGILVFEVKGLLLNQIASIKGHTWHYTNFYQKIGNPYQQAESQMFMLGNWLNKKMSVGRDIVSKRAYVVLPRINHKEWEKKGFPNFPIVFQEELLATDFFDKIQNLYYSKVKKSLTNKSGNKFKLFLELLKMSEEK